MFFHQQRQLLRINSLNRLKLIKGTAMAAALLAFLWEIQEWNQTKQQLDQAIYLFKKQEDALTNRGKLSQELARVKSKWRDINNRIWISPTPQLSLSRFLEDLEKIPGQCQIHILNKSTLPPQKIGGYHRLPVALRFNADSDRLTHLLHSLRSADKLYEVSYFNLSNNEAEKEGQRLQVLLVVNSWQKVGS